MAPTSPDDLEVRDRTLHRIRTLGTSGGQRARAQHPRAAVAQSSHDDATPAPEGTTATQGNQSDDVYEPPESLYDVGSDGSSLTVSPAWTNDADSLGSLVSSPSAACSPTTTPPHSPLVCRLFPSTRNYAYLEVVC